MCNFNTFKSNTVLIIVIAVTSLTEVITLRQAEVLVNESAFIRCFSKEVKIIQWHHTPPGKKSNKYVYAGGRFYPPYNTGRFRVNNDPTTNMYALVITNIIHEDAGLYECKDDILSGVFGSTHLTVLDSSPVCTSNMNPNGFVGPNTCNIEQENMTFSCAVSFSGNSPNLIWSTMNGSQALNSSICESKDNRINCSLSMKADPMFDGSTFICQTTTSKDARYNCSIEDIRVEYFLGNYDSAENRVDDNVTCVVASNLPIHYNWTIQQNNQENIFSANRTIYIQKPGFYKCSVKYIIQDVTCNATIVAVNVSNVVDDKETGAKSGKVSLEQIPIGLSIGISIGLFMCLVLVAVIAFFLYTKCIKGRRVSRPSSPHYVADNTIKDSEPDESECQETERRLQLIAITTPDELNLSSKIEAQREKLQDIIAPGFGLTDKLCTLNLLSPDEKSLIDAKETTFDQNKLLLDFVLKSGKCDEFVQALRDSDQTHVANWIEGNGVYALQFDLDWPLEEKELKFLRRNFEHLKKVIDTKHDFFRRLLLKKVINDRQMEFIREKSTPIKRNEAFLKILNQSSLKAFNFTTTCLRESKQVAFSKLFEKRRGPFYQLEADELIDQLPISYPRETDVFQCASFLEP